jgi:U3 small nucleolar RNA-associated protein 4
MERTELNPRAVRKHPRGGLEEKIELENTTPAVADESHSDDDVDMDEVMGGELTQLRQAKPGDFAVTPSKDIVKNGTGDVRRAWWVTHKYRPILGVVPLGDGEVALVERPTWDVEMPDRYFAGDEWER